MSETKYKYHSGGCYCPSCKAWAKHGVWFGCSECGVEDVDNFAMLRFRWVESLHQFRWWSPRSWSRGSWVFDGTAMASEAKGGE